jgi:hypothetical protein
VIMRVFGDRFQRAAYWGDVQEVGRSDNAISRGIPIGRAILDRQIVHVDDLLAKIDTEYPDAKEQQNDYSTVRSSQPLYCVREFRLALF